MLDVRFTLRSTSFISSFGLSNSFYVTVDYGCVRTYADTRVSGQCLYRRYNNNWTNYVGYGRRDNVHFQHLPSSRSPFRVKMSSNGYGYCIAFRVLK